MSHSRNPVREHMESGSFDQFFGTFKTTLDGKVLEVNGILAELLGHASPEELIDRSVDELYFDATERGGFIDELKRKKRLVKYEIHLRHRSGKAIHVLENVILREDSEGKPVIEGMVFDITDIRLKEQLDSIEQERLRARMAEEMNAVLRAEIAEHEHTQEALVKSTRLAKSLIDSSLDMIIAVDPEGLVTEFNPAATVKFGHEAQEVLGKPSRMFYADQEEFDRVQQQMNEIGSFAGEVRNVTAEGEEFVCFLTASRLFDENGNLLGAMGVSRDVTMANKDREALKASEERYRDIFDNAMDPIHSMDANGRILLVNKAWKKTLGYGDAEIGKIRIHDLLKPEDQYKAEDWLARIASGAGPEVWRSTFLAKDGRELMIEGSSSLRKENGRLVAIRSVFRDVTAAHETRELLRKHSAKDKALFETSEHMFWSVDRRIALTSFNRGYANMIERLYGHTPEINTDDRKPRKLFAPRKYHDFWSRKYDEVFAGNTVHFETDRQDKEGNRVCNEIYLSPVMDGKGRVVEAFGIGHEITAERVAEARAREQDAKLNAILESSADVMIWSMDKDFHITACNKHFLHVAKQYFGMDLQVGMNLREQLRSLAPEEMDKQFLQNAKSAFAGKVLHFESELPQKDGNAIWIEFFVSPIRTEEAINELSCMAHDITEKKQAEQEIMESLHEKEVLLKEVHHRVKNNLQIISSIFSLQRDHVEDDPRSLELLRQGQNRVRSMSFIHESLYQNKSFSQIDLADYIEGLCRNLLMSYSLTGQVKLETDLAPLMLDLDKAIPCGLILNELVSNALKHAFPDGKGGIIRIGLEERGEQVRITVEDDGKGMDKDLREPGGRGLGLELVELLTDQLDGRVEAPDAEESAGTSYLITFERN